MSFLDEVSAGMQGRNQGLPNTFNRFNAYLCGTQKKTYYAIGALPGTGKTSLADENFVLEPFFHLKAQKLPIKVNWLYYSFEVSKNAKIAKWVSNFIYRLDGTVTDPNLILSRGKHRLSGDIYTKVKKVYPVIEELLDHVKFIDEPQTPGQIYWDILKHAEANGTFQYEKYKDEQGFTQQRKVGYTPHDPDSYFIILADHVGLLKREKGLTKKDNIDKLSSMFVYFRNMCEYIPVAISQFNRALSAVDRQKFKASDLSPTLEDFKDTGSIGEDCNVALGIFNPYKFDMKTYLGYDISQLKGNFRAVNIMKNRDGEDWKNIGMQFIGGSGFYRELPKADQFAAGTSQYSQYMTQ
tara:strand:- start:6422 stop:7480 length:1059 start_codon:yes stop_codon:yes gene_type:complete